MLIKFQKKTEKKSLTHFHPITSVSNYSHELQDTAL